MAKSITAEFELRTQPSKILYQAFLLTILPITAIISRNETENIIDSSGESETCSQHRTMAA